MSSVGVIEALIALRMQLSEKFEDKRSFLYFLTVAVDPTSSIQRCPLTPETSAANRRTVDFFVIPVLP